MSFLIVLGALAFLMWIAYRGYSVILFAPVAALGAVLFTDPSLVPPMFSSVFMEKMVGFVKSYFPVFMLGAVFGKVIELSGFSKSIVSAVIGVLGRERRCCRSLWFVRCLHMAACHCLWWCLRSIRLRPKCFARAVSQSG